MFQLHTKRSETNTGADTDRAKDTDEMQTQTHNDDMRAQRQQHTGT